MFKLIKKSKVACFCVLVCLLLSPDLLSCVDSISEIASNIHFNDPYVETARAYCSIPNFQDSPFDSNMTNKKKYIPNIEYTFLKSPNLRRGETSTYVNVEKDAAGQIKEAPLLVIIPGIFSNTYENTSMYALKLAADLGFHGLILPSPFAFDFSNDALKPPGNAMEEAKLLRELAVEFKKWLGSKVKEVHLLAYSYGAFLGSVITAYDNEKYKNEKIFNGKVILISPPLDLRASFNRMDSVLDETALVSKPLSLSRALKVFKELCQAQSEDDFVNYVQFKKDIKALILLNGYQDSLAATVSNYDFINNIGVRPLIGAYSNAADYFKALSEWKTALRFRNYVSSYAPDLYEIYGRGYSNIKYWVDENLEFRSEEDFLVFTAIDDFLNDPEIVYQNRNFLTILEKGGHCGFSTSQKFLEIIKGILLEK